MKYIGLLFTVFIFSIYSCSNDFDITEDTKDIPVVYGLLNPSDTATYLRIERGFISDDQSALEIAQIPDSLYYQDLDARIVDLETDIEYMLSRVDGNLEGYVRDQGIFSIAPNYLYKLTKDEFNIEEGKQYELRLNRGDGLSQVTASTVTIQNPIISRPGDAFDLSFRRGFETFFEWRYVNSIEDENIAGIFDLYLDLKYQESIDNAPFESKRVRWKLASNLRESTGNRTWSIPVDGQRFFSTMAAGIEVNPLAVRSFSNIDLVLVSGGQEVVEFISIGQANLGITSSQDVPTYTNLSEGVGIFSSRNSLVKNSIGVTAETLDSLRLGQLTKDLNFQ